MNGIEGTLFREANAPPGTPPLVLFFEEKAVPDPVATKLEGSPVFGVAHHVRVIVAGSRNEGPIYEMWRRNHDGSEKHGEGYQRFRKPYEEWKEGKSPSATGTPLEQWPLMDVAMVATLKANHIYTVQQLSELTDGQLDASFRRGGREWRAKAQSWLDEARTAAGDAEARATIAKQQEQIEELQAQVKQMLQKQNNVGFDKPRPRRKADDDGPLHIESANEGAARL